jgi:hypothetical protein
MRPNTAILQREELFRAHRRRFEARWATTISFVDELIEDEEELDDEGLRDSDDEDEYVDDLEGADGLDEQDDGENEARPVRVRTHGLLRIATTAAR